MAAEYTKEQRDTKSPAFEEKYDSERSYIARSANYKFLEPYITCYTR